MTQKLVSTKCFEGLSFIYIIDTIAVLIQPRSDDGVEIIR